MNQADLPERWKIKLSEYLIATKSKYRSLGAESFVNNLKIEFSDGSNSYFNFAFYLTDKEENEVAVFTEHCGYHIFPLFATNLITIDGNGKIIKSEDFTNT